MKTATILHLGIIVLVSSFSTLTHAQSSTIGFGLLPNGTRIGSTDYQSLGLLLFTDPGQYLYSSGSDLVASGNGHISLEFVQPGTLIPGGVNTFSILTVDNMPGTTYTFTGYDANNQEMFQFGNWHNYSIGEGYSFSPPVHELDFDPSAPNYQFIHEISFGQIQTVPEPTILLPLGILLTALYKSL
jgi:hypothetical protein